MLAFDKIGRWPRTMIIAHRGAGHSGPNPIAYENTLAAFKEGININADAIELDLRRTRNGIIVVHHDARIGRSRWSIGDLPLEKVRKLAWETGYDIPLFEDVLKLCASKISLDIELKETGYESEIVEMVERYYDLRQVAFTSFIDKSIKRVKEVRSCAVTGLLLGEEPPAGMEKRIGEVFPHKRIAACRPDFIAPNWRFLKWLKRSRKNYGGLPVISWTINNISFAEKLIQSGIAGIISDFPERLLALIEKNKSGP
jgi:glycerophosphoryl diester phosphodiesterase